MSDIYSKGIVRFLWMLASQARPALSRHDMSRRIEFVLRLLPFTYWVKQLRTLFAQEHLRFILLARPALLDKIRRLYLDRYWSISRRTEAIISHYQWMLNTFDLNSVCMLYQSQGLLIGEMYLAQSVYRIYLSSERQFDKEGELILTLNDQAGLVIATLSFTVYNDAIYVGGLQGGSGVTSEQFRQITKESHGLRPLALMVNTIQLLAQVWGIKAVFGISSDHHVFTHSRHRHKQVQHIKRSYDELWLELGWVLNDGWYQLSSELKLRCLTEVSSNKRAMYRRRYEMMENLKAQILCHAEKFCLKVS